MTQDNITKMIDAFKTAKKLGYVKSHRQGNTGIGKTFEDICNIKENNIDAPDLHEFEIKSKRELAATRVTLFTKAPTMPKGANALLKDQYGTPDQKFPDIRVLHTSVFHRQFNTHKSGFGFKLECDDSQERMYLVVKNLDTGKIVSKDVYWSYPVLKSIIDKKLQNLAFITAKSRLAGDGEEFHFTDMTLFSGTSIDKLVEHIRMEDGLMFDVRIGAYKSGTQYGKPHDHGSGFRIKPHQLDSLYRTKYEVE